MGKLQKIINQYNKDLEGSIIKLSDSPYKGVQRASTGSFSLDVATGGGLPCSSIIELFGEESTGKSLVCLKTIAKVQKKFNKDCIYIDLENTLTLEWAVKVGVNPEKLFIVRPKTAEKALDMLLDFVSSGEVGVIVIDSVAALCPIIETEKSLEDQQMGVAARLMSKTMRGLSSTLQPESLSDIEKYNPCITLFINQTREKIGVLYGNPLTTPGGKALKFYSHVRIHLKRGEPLRNTNKSIIGQNIKFNIVKNKTHKPMQVGEFSFYYDGHIDNEKAIVDYAIVFELIEQRGAWFYFKDKKFQGKEKLIDYLKKQSKVLLRLKKDIIDILKKD